MNDEDFKQTVLDYFDIATQRDLRTMAQASDILAKIAIISTSLDTMKANFDKVYADMAETLPGGHAAVMDTLTAPLEEMLTKITTIGMEIEAKVKALPVPGAPQANA